ncbi:MAG: serine hydrolase [Clostridiaceae bacterium]|nr:serine hydrolase [Clostridiaceae bacterium]
MKINILEGLQGINEFCVEKMKQWKLPGMAIAVLKGEEIVLLSELGLRDMEKNLKVTKNTLFPIGSATKAFTSLAVGMLVEEGKLQWDTPIKNYIPHFEMKNRYVGEHLTIKDMLCHRSGLPRHDAIWYTNASLSRKELVDKIKNLELSKDFREVWQYNNIMYGAVGYIIEAVSGMSYEEFVEKRIFKPLGMNHSNFSVDAMKSSMDFSKPYSAKGEEVKQIPFKTLNAIGPAGAINSNLVDMIKWLRFHMNKGKINGNEIITEKNLTQMHSPQIPCQLIPWGFEEVQFSSYGLGWFIESYRGRKHINHGGNIDGFASYVSFMPEENLGMIILTNLNSAFNTLPIAYSIYDKILGYEDTDWDGRVKNTIDKMMKSMENINEIAATPLKETEKPLQSLEAYTGLFENSGYGALKIEKEGENLKLIYNDLECVLKHKCNNVFVFKMIEYYTITVTFNCDSDGNINSISIPFEQSVKEIVFKRCK